MWLGAALAVDFVATEAFPAVEHYLADRANLAARYPIKEEVPQALRAVMRRNAMEEKVVVFETWEWLQIGVAACFFFIVLMGDRPPRSVLIAVPVMLVVVLLQRLVLTPNLTGAGRDLADVPAAALASSPVSTRFWAFHGLYYGAEVFKLLLGAGVGARLMMRTSRWQRKEDESAKEGSTGTDPSAEPAEPPKPGQRIRKRRRVV